jgi:hypothetical protein
MKMKRYASFAEYLAGQSPRNQTIICALRKLVKKVAPDLEESVKWGNGCWVKGKVPVSYVYSGPDYLQFGFFGGSAFEDPRGLLEGDPYLRLTLFPTFAQEDALPLQNLPRIARVHPPEIRPSNKR